MSEKAAEGSQEQHQFEESSFTHPANNNHSNIAIQPLQLDLKPIEDQFKRQQHSAINMNNSESAILKEKSGLIVPDSSFECSSSLLMYTELQESFPSSDIRVAQFAHSEYDLISVSSEAMRRSPSRKAQKPVRFITPCNKYEIEEEDELVLGGQLCKKERDLEKKTLFIFPENNRNVSQKSNAIDTETVTKNVNQSNMHQRPIARSSLANIIDKKAKIDIKRERKAAKVLFVLMSCFIWYYLLSI